MSELAHLGPVELLTPAGEASLRFFVDAMGMEIEAQDGRSTYLRGWGDYQRWSLKLTESATTGCSASHPSATACMSGSSSMTARRPARG